LIHPLVKHRTAPRATVFGCDAQQMAFGSGVIR
jgi:hypothetical protein